MSIQSEITRIADNIASAFSAIRNKGVTVPSGSNSDDLATLIGQIPTGSSPSLQNKTKTYSPTESSQSETVTADSGYDGLGQVDITVGAVSSTYVGSGITRKSAATIIPGTSSQTIAAGTYLTGTQTIAGDADLVGSNILSTANIFNVQGTVVVQNYYTGQSAPSSSIGQNGDLYLQQ